jgi:DNA (cytosine-5)-methyltransferase 1
MLIRTYQNEIDGACCAVLRRQFPTSYVDQRSIEYVQREDLYQYDQGHFFAGIGGFSLGFERAGLPADVNVWTGGFPCQDLSVSGKRAGLAGERSGLYFQFHRLVTSLYPRWVVFENVPGLLSSNDGWDFAIVIGGLTGVIPSVPKQGWGNAGFARGPIYSVAYRILDAQFFGVPQRRRRVFIVGSLGDSTCSEILFEPESLPGDTPPSREAGQGYTTLFTEAAGRQAVAYIANWQSGGGKMDDNVAATIRAGAENSYQFVYGQDSGVRRLTPTECARLQGFGDDWNSWLSDAARYKQFGNAVCVPVAEWIGRRLITTTRRKD